MEFMDTVPEFVALNELFGYKQKETHGGRMCNENMAAATRLQTPCIPYESEDGPDNVPSILELLHSHSYFDAFRVPTRDVFDMMELDTLDQLMQGGAHLQ